MGSRGRRVRTRLRMQDGCARGHGRGLRGAGGGPRSPHGHGAHLGHAPTDCTGCVKYGKCELQSMYQYMGVSPMRCASRAARWRPTTPTRSSPICLRGASAAAAACARAAMCAASACSITSIPRTVSGIGTDGHVTLEQAGCRFCEVAHRGLPHGLHHRRLRYPARRPFA